MKRPIDEPGELAGVWGFSGVTLKEGEPEFEGATRVGQAKLGVDIHVSNKIEEKTVDRGEYILHLSDYEATILDGQLPEVPQIDTDMTQYIDIKYTSDPHVLFPAAQKGSLCSQIYLQSIAVDWS